MPEAPAPAAVDRAGAAASAAGAGDAAPTPAVVARALVRAGRYFGLALVLGAAVQGALEEKGWRAGSPWTAAFAAASVLLLLAAPGLCDRGALAGGFAREVARGNVAAAIVAAANRLAVGVILSHCLYGADLTTFLVSLVFAALGCVSLLVLQALFRRLTHYADDQEVRAENAAAALSFAGVTVALGITVGHAAWGPFTGWASSLGGYATALGLALALYPVRQLLVARLLLGLPFALRAGALDRAVAQERNVVVGAVEGLAYVGTALLVTGIFL